MKELSIEGKAKAYEEAIERAKKEKEKSRNLGLLEFIEDLFPELKESEDEKIRKLLVEAVIQVLQDQYCSNRGVSKERVVAWIEKQGEQKPAWSEEDEEMLKMVIKLCEQCGNEYAYYWLKSLKERYTWKPSEEQMEALDRAQAELCSTEYNKPICDLIDALNKLK